MATSDSALTVVNNYETAEYPLLHFVEAAVKQYSQQQVIELRNLQMLTRRYPELFVQHFCALLEETTSAGKQEVKLTVTCQAFIGDQEAILKAAEDKPKIKEQIVSIRLLAEACLYQEGLRCKHSNLVVCLVTRKQLPEIRIGFRQYQFDQETQSETKLLPNEIPSFAVDDRGVFEYFEEKKVELEDNAVNMLIKLLRVEQTYFSKVFAETDQMVKCKQFQGEEKWLMQHPSIVSFVQRIDGKEYPTTPYFSNSFCKTHFFGWSPQGKALVEKDIQNGKVRWCEVCKAKLGDFLQDAIMNRIMTCVYNPRKLPILYFPAANRFKLRNKGSNEIIYENYYHFRDTITALGSTIQSRHCMTGNRQEFSMTFALQNKKRLIENPCRGQECRHLSFCDLRDIYRTKKNFTYTCPICKNEIQDSQLLYLKEILPLLKLAKHIMKKKKAELTGIHSYFRIEVIHGPNQKDQNVRLKNRLHFGQQEEVVEVPRIYRSLLDPLYPYDQSELNLSDEELEEEVNNYYWPKVIDMDS